MLFGYMAGMYSCMFYKQHTYIQKANSEIINKKKKKKIKDAFSRFSGRDVEEVMIRMVLVSGGGKQMEREEVSMVRRY